MSVEKDNDPRQRLWAPWRMSYVAREMPGGCFLCDAVKESGAGDEKNLVLYRGNKIFIMLNLFPYNNGHLMLFPARHISSIESLTSTEEREYVFLLKQTVRILQNKLKAQGFNMGMNMGKAAGAGLDSHIHWHVVPRWHGDTNFMPVVAGIKVIPQSLHELYAQLKPEFQSKCRDNKE